MTSRAGKQPVRIGDQRLTTAEIHSMLDGFRHSGSNSPNSSPHSPPSWSRSWSPSCSPGQHAFEVRRGLRAAAPSPRRTRGADNCFRPKKLNQSGSPKGRSLTPDSYQYALYSSLSPGGWRSGGGTPESESIPRCWDCQKRDGDIVRLTEENKRLTEENKRLTRRSLIDSLFEGSPSQ